MCAKKRHNKSSDFLRYLQDDLSNQERYALEKNLESDPFERDAMEGLEGIEPGKAQEDILSLHAALDRRIGRKRRRNWYGIAATAASILIVGTIFLNIYDLRPDEPNQESLTEESLRILDSGNEATAPGEESVVSEEAPASKAAPVGEKPAPTIRREEQSKSDPPPAAVAAAVPAEDVIREERVPEMLLQEDEAIVVKEAQGQRSKKSVGKEKMDAPVAYAPAASKTLAEKPGPRVSGLVLSSEDMEPLPGARIVIGGTDSGTISDMEGRFTLPSDDSQATVVASFIGMETAEYQLTREGDNQLVMQPDPMTLDEVVVLARGNETQGSPVPSEPKGGYKLFRDYIAENMVFPEGYIPGERKVVILSLTVTATAALTRIEILRSPGEAYSREAIRLIQDGPEWVPASTENGPIDEQVRIRIVFKKGHE